MKSQMLGLVLVAVLSAACAPALELTWFDRTPHAARPASAVAVIAAFPSDRPYLSLARIEVADGGWRESRASMVRRIQERAAAAGADAVVIEETTTRRRTAITPEGAGRFHERVVVGTAIVF